MIVKIIDEKNNTFWLIFHFLLGIGCSFFPELIILFLYLVLLLSFNQIISTILFNGSKVTFLASMIYVSSFEVFARMNQTSPFIPWELSKYIFIFIGITSLFNFNVLLKKSMLIPFMLFLLLPGAFLDLSMEVSFNQIIFNLFGLVSLISLLFFIDGIEVDEDILNSFLKLIWLPLTSILFYIIIKTPDYSDLIFSLNANRITAGGFGSNQVSTMLGAGMFLSFYAWMNKLKFSGYHTLDGILIGLFAYQGFMTFSRGGMIIGIISIFIYFFLFKGSKDYLSLLKIKALKPISFFITALIVIITSYILILRLSDGNVAKRYQGETETTLSGEKIKTLNTITTGRYNIMLGDLELWDNNFLFGTGVGASKLLRKNIKYKAASHNEFSRLVAEHGLFGLTFIIILFYLFFQNYFSYGRTIYSALIVAMFFIGVGTMLHSSMRTFIPTIFISLSFLKIKRVL